MPPLVDKVDAPEVQPDEQVGVIGYCSYCKRTVDIPVSDTTVTRLSDYQKFLESKAALAGQSGIEVSESEIHQTLKPHQAAIVRWAVRGGRRAIFASFGLGKTLIQLEILRIILSKKGGRGLIVCPLGVRQEFVRDGALIGVAPRFIRTTGEASAEGIYLTNYESVREGKLNPCGFTVVSLDEAAVLRGFGGSKTFREFMKLYEGTSSYRFVATATPDPNEFIELLAYAAFLDIMDVGQAKTRFFKRDSTKADRLTIHPHKEKEFWIWVSSWACFVQKPSDVNPEFSDDGYVLPPMDVRWQEIPSDHSTAVPDKDGQRRMFKDSTYGVSEAAREKKESLPARIRRLMELRAEDPKAHRIIWHDLEDERKALEEAIPGLTTVYGTQDLDARESAIIRFSDGQIQELGAKPVLAGSGCNFQRYCSWAIFLGIGFKFADFIQAIHRIYRFLQTRTVRIDLIYTESERSIRQVLEDKWRRHDEQTRTMAELIRKYGLAEIGKHELARTIGVRRQEVVRKDYRLINADCVEECRTLPGNSIDLIVTSIPFATQYEYTPTYNDFGHTDSNEHFWQQMDFLTPQLFRILRPGRIAAIHVKDRITPMGITGMGFQTVQPFHAEAIFHYTRHGFGYLGMKTIVTDVVRENNQTYRLGWTEQCKDGTKMGVGMPEYLLLFRKPPTDRSRGYADVPVVKDKRTYTRSRWQIDAHGFSRSSGVSGRSPEELRTLSHGEIFRRWKHYSLSTVYDYEEHVATAEALERCAHCGHIHTGQRTCGECSCSLQGGRLPTTFMLLPPHSWHPDVWTDVARMRTLNTLQAQRGREMHLCPLQFDIVERLIIQHSMEGETVLDPFAGLMTVPYCAVRLKRKAIGIELSPSYFRDGCMYVAAAENEKQIPRLFDILEGPNGTS